MDQAFHSSFLQDRVVLITGASKGIGRALAKSLAAYQATVILLGRNTKALESVYDEIIKEGNAKPAIYPFNLANPSYEDYETLANNIELQLEGLDHIIHNAAMLGPLSPLIHYPVSEWQQVLQVNLNSVFMLTKATLPLLKKRDKASIILTLADVGLKARAYWGGYAVSKFGIKALLEILHDELEVNTNIRVNAVLPSKVRTGLRSSAYPAESVQELLLPENITKHYLALLHPSNKSRGEIIEI